MKKFFLILLIFVFLPLGVVGYIVYDPYVAKGEYLSLPDDLQTGKFAHILKTKVLGLYATYPQSVPLFLSEHLPKVFPINNYCWRVIHSQEDQQDLVLPGRQFNESASYTCKNGESFIFRDNTVAFLSFGWLGNAPSHLFILSGKVSFQFGKGSYYISLPDSSFLLSGKEDSNFVVAIRRRKANLRESVICEKGNIQAQIIETAAWRKDSSIIVNRECHMEFKHNESDQVRELTKGSAISANEAQNYVMNQEVSIKSALEILESERVEDASGNSPTQSGSAPAPSTPSAPSAPGAPSAPSAPSAPKTTTPANTEMKIVIQMAPKPKGDVFVFRYQLPVNQPMVCNLKTGSSPNGPFANAYQFQAPNKAGTLDLQKGFAAFYVGLECTDGKKTIGSNIIPPKK